MCYPINEYLMNKDRETIRIIGMAMRPAGAYLYGHDDMGKPVCKSWADIERDWTFVAGQDIDEGEEQ